MPIYQLLSTNINSITANLTKPQHSQTAPEILENDRFITHWCTFPQHSSKQKWQLCSKNSNTALKIQCLWKKRLPSNDLWLSGEVTQSGVLGGSVEKYGVASFTRMVWQTSQTLAGRIFGPLWTVLDIQSEQNIRPQWRQWCCKRKKNSNYYLSSTVSTCLMLVIRNSVFGKFQVTIAA